MAAASTVKVSINLPVPDPIILNNSSKNCDGDAKLPKKRKITTVDEHKSVNESGDMKWNQHYCSFMLQTKSDQQTTHCL